MSTVIEQKVVEMRFDNKNFEQNVAQSMSTLDKLKEALSKSTSVNAFDGLAKAANKVDLSGVSSSIQKVTENFSVLEQIAIGALRRIGESIEEHLVRGLKNVTFGNVISGWERFAQKTESTQTILSAIANDDQYGEDKLGYVEELLEKLAWFSDETSYNFTDMTDNISKFTAAGMNLDKSTDAMMGIATWAAMSGQNASVASRAMYQLSQAMGKGEINLVDWKSIEVANMATKEVKQMLMDYAYMSKSSGLKLDELGYYVEKVTKAGVEKIRVDNGSFRETLQYGWLTADAFSDAMKEYASYSNALYDIINNESNSGKGLYASGLIRMLDKAQKKAEQTGQTIEDIMRADYQIEIGNSLEGVTELGIRAMKAAQQARTFQQAIDAVNDAASTKWATIFEKVIGNVEEATVFYTDLAEYLYDIFIEPLNAVIETLSEWKEKGGRDFLFGYEDEDGKKINGALQNIGEAITAIREAIGTGIGAVFAAPTADQLVTLTERFKKFTERLIISEDTAKGVSNVFFRITSGIKSFGSALWNIAKAVGRVFKKIYTAAESVLGDSISHLFHSVTQFFYNFGTSVRKVFENVNISESATEKFKKILEAVKVVINAISGAFDKLNKKLADFVRGQHFQKVAEFLGGKFLDILLWLPSKIADVIVWIDKFVNTDSKFSGFVSGLGKVFTSIKEFIGGFVKAMLPAEGLPGLFDKIKTAFEGFIEKIKESKVFSWLADALTNAYNAVKKFFKESMNAEGGASAFETIRDALQKFGETVANVYNSVKDFIDANIDFDKIGEALSKAGNAIATAFGGAYEALKNFFSLFKKNKTTTSDVTKASNAVDNLNSPSAFDSMQKAKIGGEFDSDAAREGLMDFVQKIPELFDKAAKSANDLAEGIGKVGDKVGEVAKQVETSSFLQTIKDVWSAVSAFISDLFTGSNSLTDLAQNDTGDSGVLKFFSGALTFIRKIASYFADNLPALLTGGGLLAIGLGIKQFSEGFIKISRGLKTFLKNVGWAASYWGKGEMFKGLGKLLLSLAGAIVIFLLGLAGAIYLLNGVMSDTVVTQRSLNVIIAGLAGLLISLMALIALVNAGNWKNNAAEAAKFTGVALMLKSLAVSVAIMCLAVALMTKWVSGLSSTEMENAETVFYSLLELIGVVGVVMALIARGKGGFALVGVLAMILGIKLLIDTVVNLYEYFNNNIIDEKLLTAAVVIVGGLIVLLELMSGISSYGQRSVKAGVVMLIAAAVIAIMAQVLIKIAKVIKNVRGTTLVAAGAIVLGLGLLLSLMVDLVSTCNSLKGAGSLLLASAAIAIMTGILYAIKEMVREANDSGLLLKALGIMALLEIVLAFGVGLAELLGKNFAQMAIGELGLAVMGAILWGVIEYVLKPVYAMTNENTNAAYNAVGVLALVEAVLLASVGICELLGANTLLMLGGELGLAAMGAILWGMIEYVFKPIYEMVKEDAKSALYSAIGIAAMVVVLGGALALLSGAALGMIGAAIALGILGLALMAMGEVLSTITELIKTNPKETLEAAIGMAAAVAVLGLLLAVLGAASPGMMLAAAGLIVMAGSLYILVKTMELLGPALEGLVDALIHIPLAISENKSDILGAVETVWEALKLSAEEFVDAIDSTLHKIIDLFFGDGKDKKGLIKELLEGIAGSFEDFVETGTSMVSSICSGITKSQKTVNDAFDTIIGNAVDFVVTLSGTLLRGLIKLINGVADSIEENTPDFAAACTHLGSAIRGAIWAGLSGSMFSIGLNIAKGLGEGIKEGVSPTSSFFDKLYIQPFRWAKKKIEELFEEHSPSKWSERIGVYIDQGLANGILKAITEPTQASELLGDNVMDSLSGKFDNIEDMFSDLDPTITPVLDLSQFKNDMVSMDNMFGDYSIDSLYNANLGTDSVSDLLGDFNLGGMFDNLTNTLTGTLEGKFDELLGKLSNLQVVLDSGELVGGLVDPMDDALGNKAVYAGRAVR